MGILLGRRRKDETGEQGESTTSVIKSLMDEEVCLTEERDKLLTLKEELQHRAKEKIETVTSSIQELKNQVYELRLECEQLREFISNSK